MTEFLSVKISIKNDVLAVGEVPIKATQLEVPLSLTELTPRKNPCRVSCSITYGGDQGYTTSSSLSYLPNPPSGFVAEFDFWTGGLWMELFDDEYTTGYTPVSTLRFLLRSVTN